MRSVSQLFSGNRRASGFVAMGPHRLKELSITGGAFDGLVGFFDTDVAPIVINSASQSGTTVTVNTSAHGLSTGDTVGIVFYGGTNNDPDSGNYEVTVVDATNFTIEQLNSATIPISIGQYVKNSGTPNSPRRFVLQKLTKAAGADDIDIPISFSMPDAGFKFDLGMYAVLNNIGTTDVIYE